MHDKFWSDWLSLVCDVVLVLTRQFLSYATTPLYVARLKRGPCPDQTTILKLRYCGCLSFVYHVVIVLTSRQFLSYATTALSVTLQRGYLSFVYHIILVLTRRQSLSYAQHRCMSLVHDVVLVLTRRQFRSYATARLLSVSLDRLTCI